jgi:hypothetical protein
MNTKTVDLPERVIDQLFQAAGVSTYHPDGDQIDQLRLFARNVVAETLARLPSDAPQAASGLGVIESVTEVPRHDWEEPTWREYDVTYKFSNGTLGIHNGVIKSVARMEDDLEDLAQGDLIRDAILATAQVNVQPAVVDEGVEAFIGEVRAELLRARKKFPGDRIMTIALAEEFGELCKAVLDESAANVRKEAVQTAVMAARVVLDGDSSVTAWRAERGLDPLIIKDA